MTLKKIIPTLLISVYSIVLHAQEIAIPYRDGTKWGMCNPEGKIILEPQYDQLEFKQNYDSDYRTVYSKLKDKTGLIIDGKVFFEAKYSQLYFDDENYVLISEDTSTKTTDIVDKKGNSILKKPIIEIITSEHVSETLKLYQVLNVDFTESIFTLNKKTNTIEQWLYEDYFSIHILKKVGGRYNLVCNSKKLENDALQTEVWNFEKAPYVKSNKVLFQTEDQYLEQFYKKAKTKSTNYSGYGSGSGSGDVMVDQGVEDAVYSVERGYGDVVADREEGTNANKPQLYFNYSLQKDNDNLLLETKQEYTKVPKKFTTQVKRKASLKNLEIINYSYYKHTNDSVLNYRNIAFYKTKNKVGVVFPDEVSRVIEFDTIIKSFAQVNRNNTFEEVTFIVGNKGNKSNAYKYSLFSSKKGLFFPLQFDEIVKFQYKNNNGNVVYKTKMGSKFGLIESNGNVLLKPEYEDFKRPAYNSHSSNVTKTYLLKKNNKFGLIYQNEAAYKEEIIDAIFDYEIDDVLINYPNKARYATSQSNLKLVTLKNVDNEIVGYANANGTLYFKN